MRLKETLIATKNVLKEKTYQFMLTKKMKKEDCIKTIKGGKGVMTVNICTMVEDCNCGKEDCCPA